MKASGLLLKRLNRKTWLFDCGEGILKQHQIYLSRKNDNGVEPMPANNDIDKIFITHMHGDHVNGLPSLLHDICILLQFKHF